ncbi:hypothetical protein NEDG_00694 [Nematocida displodere]|uniref:Uncharacterized protein n=1 Tax=Nematocida displodere TaxID=1805483 RepID=A0A177EDH0_9MICR|nr:hypothetical protein NEDG_00694 [Nematocida displodere]
MKEGRRNQKIAATLIFLSLSILAMGLYRYFVSGETSNYAKGVAKNTTPALFDLGAKIDSEVLGMEERSLSDPPSYEGSTIVASSDVRAHNPNTHTGYNTYTNTRIDYNTDTHADARTNTDTSTDTRTEHNTDTDTCTNCNTHTDTDYSRDTTEKDVPTLNLKMPDTIGDLATIIDSIIKKETVAVDSALNYLNRYTTVSHFLENNALATTTQDHSHIVKSDFDIERDKIIKTYQNAVNVDIISLFYAIHKIFAFIGPSHPHLHLLGEDKQQDHAIRTDPLIKRLVNLLPLMFTLIKAHPSTPRCQKCAARSQNRYQWCCWYIRQKTYVIDRSGALAWLTELRKGVENTHPVPGIISPAGKKAVLENLDTACATIRHFESVRAIGGQNNTAYNPVPWFFFKDWAYNPIPDPNPTHKPFTAAKLWPN